MALQLQYDPVRGGLLMHDAVTNPAQAGKLMGECCCNLDACQWAIDWIYVCIGRCYGDPAVWSDTQTPSTISGDVHNPAAWAATTAYTTPGQLVVSGGAVYGLKIKHTSGASFDADYWIDESGWVAYQNGASGTVTPATYPDANAYQHSTDASVQGPPPAPGIHCAGHPGAVGQSDDLYGCSATRYGPLHGVDNCPATPDVSMDTPTACEHSAMCGACVQCGPASTDCFGHTIPGVLPCSVNVTVQGELWKTDTGKIGDISYSGTLNLVRCDPDIGLIGYPSIKYQVTVSPLPPFPCVEAIIITFYTNTSPQSWHWIVVSRADPFATQITGDRDDALRDKCVPIGYASTITGSTSLGGGISIYYQNTLCTVTSNNP